jgi:hypothetical protein
MRFCVDVRVLGFGPSNTLWESFLQSAMSCGEQRVDWRLDPTICLDGETAQIRLIVSAVHRSDATALAVELVGKIGRSADLEGAVDWTCMTCEAYRL